MYFNQKGCVNTEETVRLALATAKERGIRHIAVASNTGGTAILLAGHDLGVVCVTHVNGFAECGKNEMPHDMRAKLQASGIQVLTTSHVLSGAERGISSRFGGAYPIEIMAHTLRMFGAGVKVAVEVSVMALDAGLIPYGEPIIAVAGTKRGADTAVILTPAHAADILGTQIHEIICKPA